MSEPATPTPPTLRWPPERFYWSVLEAPACRGQLPPGLRAALEDDAPAEDLHAVCLPIDDGNVLVCGAPRADLAALDDGVLRLTPESVPPQLGETDPVLLNLLVGEFEPRPVRRARERRHLLTMAAVGLCAALLTLGLMRRTSAWHAEGSEAVAANLKLAQSVGTRPETIGTELEKARRESGTEAKPAPDAAITLASILTAWPASVPSKPQSLMVSGDSASLSVAIEGEPTPFLKAFSTPKGWTLDEPRLNAAGNLTRLTLQLRRAPTGGAP